MEDYGSLLDFIPRFESGEFDDAFSEYMRTGRYVQCVNELMAAAQETNLYSAFNWIEWIKTAEYRTDPGSVSRASLEELSKIITYHLRNDRFSGGHFRRSARTDRSSTGSSVWKS